MNGYPSCFVERLDVTGVVCRRVGFVLVVNSSLKIIDRVTHLVLTSHL